MRQPEQLIPRPKTRPFEDGSGWCVEFTWPDGRIEKIGTFGSEASAQDWVEHEFEKYFQEKLAH
jgi:hypothetical protein